MRMQKTAMEFVEFDAKDVITTSNQWTGYGMYAPYNLVQAFNESQGADGKKSFISMTGNAGGAYNPDVTMDDTNYYPSAPIKVDAPEWNLDNYTSNGVTYKQAKTLQDILDWLAGNNLQ